MIRSSAPSDLVPPLAHLNYIPLPDETAAVGLPGALGDITLSKLFTILSHDSALLPTSSTAGSWQRHCRLLVVLQAVISTAGCF